MNNTTIGKLVKEGIIEEPMDGNHGELHPTSKDYVTTGIPFIMASDIENGCVNYSSCKYITKETANTLRKGFAYEGDVLLTHKATIGRTAILKKLPTEFAMLTPQVTYYRIKKPSVLHPYYLKYYFDSPYFQTIIKQRAGAGSTRAYIGILQQNELPISYPKYEIQKQVVDVLKSLDDKIENNYYISTELETMSKTIYDYWFVQFDFPDENGKPYRTSGGEMVWNEQLKREIPKGWEVGRLCDIANITMGQSPTGESYNDIGDGLIFYQGRTDFGLRFPTPRMYTTAPTRFAQKGDILLSVRAPVGDLNFAMEDCCIGRGLAALNSKLGSQMHLFYTLTGFQQIFKVMDGNGTTFGSITKDILFGMAVVIPSDEILKCFDKMVKPIELKIEKCEEEIRELTKLRDWLLPMLMNGQARVE